MDDSHVLLIEKDQNRAAGIAKGLPDRAKLSIISDARNALHILMRNTFDLIALNGLLNGVQGLFTYLYDLREAKNTMLLLYPVRDSDARAHFFKCFDICLAEENPQECAAAISALLRWPGAGAVRDGDLPPGRIIYKDLGLDLERQAVVMRGKPVELTTVEFRVLFLLASNPGILFSRDRIYDRLWGIDHPYGVMGVSNFISSIRRKLGLSPKDREYIRTVHGAGYQFGKWNFEKSG